MRHCIRELYLAEGIDHKGTNTEVKQVYDTKCASDGSRPARLLEWFNWVLESHPPIFHKWLIGRFPEPAAWLDARLAFTRTYAAWSMVGHMVGLGDRHGENILIDEASGDAVFIDFACLFDKGLTLRDPEVVPFRLTQNVIDAFGPAGPEGVYRRVCEITLGVLRKNQGTILSVMDTLLHDPLVEWTRQEGTGGGAGERDNPHAKDAMHNLEGRLRGTLLGVRSLPCMPLSVEGHAHRLVQEASSKENLSKMYLWWQAWY
jgi:serine/threonine-protein kinase ATR